MPKHRPESDLSDVDDAVFVAASQYTSPVRPLASTSQPQALRRARDEQLIGDLEEKLRNQRRSYRSLQDHIAPISAERDALKLRVAQAEPERARLQAALDEAERTLHKLAAVARRVILDSDLQGDDDVVETDKDGERTVAKEDCSICLESWTDDWTAASLWPCGHALHTACSQEWISRAKATAAEQLEAMFADEDEDPANEGKFRCPVCNSYAAEDKIIEGVSTIEEGWHEATELLETWAVKAEAKEGELLPEAGVDGGASEDDVREASLESSTSEDPGEGRYMVGATGGVEETSSEEDEPAPQPRVVTSPGDEPTSSRKRKRAIITSDDEESERTPPKPTRSPRKSQTVVIDESDEEVVPVKRKVSRAVSVRSSSGSLPIDGKPAADEDEASAVDVDEDDEGSEAESEEDVKPVVTRRPRLQQDGPSSSTARKDRKAKLERMAARARASGKAASQRF